ncbi:MAG: alanine/ornithine racemase family PLP-dependent enzyme [Spirochaetaceae bacterium]|jgi:predicted amino acid racemase|nr:alanine/ornithine racemase family PLP-dependent enzyme [Spirochaetaceae bacterium]
MENKNNNKYPRLAINLDKLNDNLSTLSGAVHGAGCSLMIVTKSFCACPEIIDFLLQSKKVDYLADSRIQNLSSYTGRGKETVLLRLPQKDEIEEVVRFADISFNSEIKTIRLLNTEAAAQKKTHKVVLMIDLGDLREGIYFKNEDEIFRVAGEIQALPNIKFAGIGTNLTCYGAVIPTRKNLSVLCGIAEKIEAQHNLKLEIISGGNSSSYYLIGEGGLPPRINNLRLGESFIRGVESAYCKRIPQTHDDAVTLECQIIELKEKPSVPVGDIGVDAFGNKPHFEDRGIIKRAIAACGKQDTDPDGLFPMDSGIRVLGASSDHLLLDLSGSARNYRLGDVVPFVLNYSALLRAFTSRYVRHFILGR